MSHWNNCSFRLMHPFFVMALMTSLAIGKFIPSIHDTTRSLSTSNHLCHKYVFWTSLLTVFFTIYIRPLGALLIMKCMELWIKLITKMVENGMPSYGQEYTCDGKWGVGRPRKRRTPWRNWVISLINVNKSVLT